MKRSVVLTLAALAAACGPNEGPPDGRSTGPAAATTTTGGAPPATAPPTWTALGLRFDGDRLDAQGLPAAAMARLAQLFPDGRPNVIVADTPVDAHDPARALALTLAVTRLASARLVVDGAPATLTGTAWTEADAVVVEAEVRRQLGPAVALAADLRTEATLPPFGRGLVGFGAAAAIPRAVRAIGADGALGPAVAPPVVVRDQGLVVLPAGLYALDGDRAVVVPPNLRVDLEPGAPSLVVGGRRFVLPKRVPLSELGTTQSFAALDQDDEHPRWSHRYRAPADPLLPRDLAELRSFVTDVVFLTTPTPSLADELAAEVAAGTSSHLALARDGAIIQRLDLLEAARCGAPDDATALCVVVAIDPTAPGLSAQQRRSLDGLFELVGAIFPTARAVIPEALGGWSYPDPYADGVAHPIIREPLPALPPPRAAPAAPEPARVTVAWRRGLAKAGEAATGSLVATGLTPTPPLVERATLELRSARERVVLLAPARPNDLAPDRARALLGAVTRLDEADLALAEGRATLTGKAYNEATRADVEALVRAALPGVTVTATVTVDGATPHPSDGFLDLPEPGPTVVKDLDDHPVAVDDRHHVPAGLYRLADGSIVGVRRGQHTRVVAGAAAFVVAGERVPLDDASVRVVVPGDPNARAFTPAGAAPRDASARRAPDLRALALDAVVVSTDRAADAAAGFERLRASGDEVHFIIDFDGTIYETLDPVWTPAEARPPGAGTLAAAIRKQSVSIALTGLAPDLRLDGEAPSFPPDHPRADELALHPRPRGPLGLIHGRKVETYGPTDAQYRALAALLRRLAEIAPHGPWSAPRGRDGKVRTDVLRSSTPSEGVVFGRFHLDPTSTDPSPAFDWDRLARELDVSSPRGGPR